MTSNNYPLTDDQKILILSRMLKIVELAYRQNDPVTGLCTLFIKLTNRDSLSYSIPEIYHKRTTQGWNINWWPMTDGNRIRKEVIKEVIEELK